MKANNIPTPDVYAAVVFKKYGLPDGALLITQCLAEQDQQCDLIVSEFIQPGNYPSFISGLTGLLCRMHACGFQHGDLNLRNIYCRRCAAGGFSDWGVIDLDGCSVSKKGLSRRKRTLELARLIGAVILCAREAAISMPDTLKEDFLRTYQEISGIDLAGTLLDRRITYHVERIRRNH